MSPRTTRIVALVALLGLLGAGLVGALVSVSSSGTTTDRPAASSAPQPGSRRPPAPELADFYAQDLSWSSCRGGFECARLTVPLDYQQPQGATIELAVLRVPAGNPRARIGALVVNPGGPGAPGTDYAAQAAQVFREPLLNQFDIVGFDPRGTGASDPVDCLSDQQLDDFTASDPDPDTPAEAAEYAGWVDALGAGCLQRSGALAAHVSTLEAARDIDVLRAALGESSLTYFGASYGTKLGATYAELFPDRVGRMVLDGAVDLSIDARQLSLEQAAGFETALRSYVQDCVDQGGCFLGDSADEGLTRIKRLLDEVDARPLPTDTERSLAVGNAFYGIVTPLYNRDYWYLLTRALKAALAGDGSLLLQLSDYYTSRGPDGSYLDNSAEAIYAINCLDDPYAIRADQVPQAEADFAAASPTFGDVFAWGLTSCGGIRVKATELPRPVRASGAAPIVVIGTTRDPATPYQWAVHLADQLESGVLVTRDGDGHTGYNAGNACVNQAVESYLVTGVAPEDRLAC